MDSLPEDLTRDILSKVGDVQHLANFSGACKAFHSVHWPVLYAGNRGALLSRHMSGLQGIRIWVRNETDWQEWKILIEKSSSTLEEISFSLSGMDMFKNDIWSFLEKFPRLSSICYMRCNRYNSPRHSFPNLRSASLSLNTCGQDDIQNLLKSAPLLETLELFSFGTGRIVVEGCNLKVLKAEIPGVDLTVAKCKRLETLHVSFVESLALGYESLPSLRDIGWCSIQGTLDSLLLSGLSDVENLVITDCELSEGCQVLTIPGDRLKILEYSGQKFMKLRVERCERLESLDVSRAESFELGGSCPRLRKACVCGVKNFGDKQLSELLFDSPRLKELEIKKCYGSLLSSSITLCSSSLETLFFHGRRNPRTTLNVKCKAIKKLRLRDNCLVELGDSIPTHVCLDGIWSLKFLRQFTRLSFVTKLVHFKLDIIGTRLGFDLDLEEKARMAVRLLSRSVTVTMHVCLENELSDLEKAIRQLVPVSPRLQTITFKRKHVYEGYGMYQISRLFLQIYFS